MATEFDWDPRKATLNLKKHGITFETAARMFADPFAVSEFDREVDGEIRWQTIGFVNGQTMLLVVHTDWDEDGIDFIRIICARMADAHERKRYEKNHTETRARPQ